MRILKKQATRNPTNLINATPNIEEGKKLHLLFVSGFNSNVQAMKYSMICHFLFTSSPTRFVFVSLLHFLVTSYL
jgi:hypothetical protein